MKNYKKMTAAVLSAILCLPMGIFADDIVSKQENAQETVDLLNIVEKEAEEKEQAIESEREEAASDKAETETSVLREGFDAGQQNQMGSVGEKADEGKPESIVFFRAMDAATEKKFEQTVTVFEKSKDDLVAATTAETWTNVKNLVVKLDGETLQSGRSKYLLKKGEYFFGGIGKTELIIGKDNFTEYRTYTLEISADGYETANFTFEYVEELPPTKSLPLTVNRPTITQGKILEVNLGKDTTANSTELSQFFSKNDLKITIDGQEVDAKNISTGGSGKTRAFRVTPSEPWAIGEHQVIVKKKGYIANELTFTVDKVVKVDVVSSPTPLSEAEKDFKTSYFKGDTIAYKLLAIDITFANGKVSRSISNKYFDDWKIKLSPTEGSKIVQSGKQNVVLSIEDFQKEIPIEVSTKRFELKTPWVKVKESIKVDYDPSDSSYDMRIGGLIVKVGSEKEKLTALRSSQYTLSSSNKSIEIKDFSTKEGKLFVEVSHDAYESELFEVMVAAEEPTEFLELQRQRAELKAAVEKAEKLDISNKTDASKAVLADAVKNAKAALENENGTAKQLKDSLEALQNAVEGLKDKPVIPAEPNDPPNGGNNQGQGNEGSNSNNANTSADSVGFVGRASVRPDAFTKETVVPDNATPLVQKNERPVKAVLSIGSKSYKKMADGALTEAMTDMAPILQDGRTMLPTRMIAELLGVEVSYDAASKTTTLTYLAGEKKNVITLILGEKRMKVNGEFIEISTEVTQLDGRTLLPLRDIQRALEGLGLEIEIEWNAQAKEITIR